MYLLSPAMLRFSVLHVVIRQHTQLDAGAQGRTSTIKLRQNENSHDVTHRENQNTLKGQAITLFFFLLDNMLSNTITEWFQCK